MRRLPTTTQPTEGGRLLRPLVATVVLVASTTGSRASAADRPVVRDARVAYGEGASAFDRGDFQTAAKRFAEADSLAPSPVVLEMALKCATKIDDGVLAMQLAERADARGATGDLARSAQAARTSAASRVGYVQALCPSDMHCSVRVDGAEAVAGVRTWLAVGEHLVELASDGVSERFPVRVVAGAGVDVRPTRVMRIADTRASEPAPVAVAATEEPKPVPPTTSRKGISSAWFWTGAAITAGLGAGTIVSGIDTSSKHASFASSPSDAVAAAGRDAQTRTNVLLVATGVSAAATLGLGLFGVDWSKRTTSERGVASIRGTIRGAGFSLEGDFR